MHFQAKRLRSSTSVMPNVFPLQANGFTGSTARHKQKPHIVGVMGVVAVMAKGLDNLLNFAFTEGRHFRWGHWTAHLGESGEGVLPFGIYPFVVLHPVAKVIQDNHLFLNRGGGCTPQHEGDKILGLSRANNRLPKGLHPIGNGIVQKSG